MILLDTNVISEPMRREPEARVLAWLDRQPSETLFLSAITVAEIRKGIALLPAGKRQTLLAERLDKLLLPMFHGRILPFDIHTTPAYASVIAHAALPIASRRATARRPGRGITHRDRLRGCRGRCRVWGGP